MAYDTHTASSGVVQQIQLRRQKAFAFNFARIPAYKPIRAEPNPQPHVNIIQIRNGPLCWSRTFRFQVMKRFFSAFHRTRKKSSTFICESVF